MSSAQLDAVPAAPTLSVSEAEAIALGLFGLRALPGKTKSLGSCQDANYRVCTTDGTFVLKVSNVAFDEAVLDLQNQAMLHLGARMAHRKALQIPAPLRRVCAMFPESARCAVIGWLHLCHTLCRRQLLLAARVKVHSLAASWFLYLFALPLASSM